MSAGYHRYKGHGSFGDGYGVHRGYGQSYYTNPKVHLPIRPPPLYGPISYKHGTAVPPSYPHPQTHGFGWPIKTHSSPYYGNKKYGYLG